MQTSKSKGFQPQTQGFCSSSGAGELRAKPSLQGKLVSFHGVYGEKVDMSIAG
jgi:hypothetical protein